MGHCYCADCRKASGCGFIPLQRYGQGFQSFEIGIQDGPAVANELKAAGCKLSAEYGTFFYVRPPGAAPYVFAPNRWLQERYVPGRGAADEMDTEDQDPATRLGKLGRRLERAFCDRDLRALWRKAP
jgi:hypothetical protein